MDNLSLNHKLDLLVNAPLPEFLKLCSVNKEFNQICNGTLPIEITSVFGNLTESLYKQRSEREFSDNILQFRNVEQITWREFYIRIKKLFMDDLNSYVADHHAAAGKFLEIKILGNLSPPNGPVFPSVLGAILATKYGHINIVRYLVYLDPPVLPDAPYISYLISNSKNNDIIKIMIDNGKYLFSTINDAIYYGNYEILNYLLDRSIPLEYNSLESAAIASDLEMFKYVLSKISDNTRNKLNNSLQNAIKFNNLEIVKFIISQEIKPQVYHFYEALQLSDPTILKYFISIDYYPTLDQIKNALIVNSSQEMKDYLKTLIVSKKLK